MWALLPGCPIKEKMHFFSKGAGNIWLGGTISESHVWNPKEVKHDVAAPLIQGAF